MAWKICLVLLFAVSAYGRVYQQKPKLTNHVASVLKEARQSIPDLMEPGPVIIRVNAVEEVSHDPTQSVECTMCEYAMTELKNLIGQNSTREEIKQELEKLCSMLPSTVSEECDTFVNKYEDEILKILSQGLDPDMVCTSLNLCTKAKALDNVDGVEAGELCALCEFVMGKLDAILKENATEQEIEQALEQVCGLLPASLRSECDGLVQEYGPMIIQLLLQELEPGVICTQLGLCNTTMVVQVRESALEEKPKISATPQCEACEVIMTQLDEIIKNNATRERIEQYLTQLCGFLPPGPTRNECVKISQYTKIVFDLLINLGPNGVCKLLKLCDSNAFGDIKLPLRRLASMMPGSNTTCEVCVKAIDGIKAVAAENSTQHSVESLLKMICFYMLPIYKECTAFIEDNVPKFFKLIASLNSTEVCQEIGACAKVDIMDIRCHLGAVYRCSSREAAKRCNSLSYCKKFAWNNL